MRAAFTLLQTLITTAMLVTSAPIDNTNTLSVRGNPGSIYLCNGPNWTGACTYIEHSLIAGGCTPVPLAFAHAQSIGGDDGPSCAVYSQANCGGASLDVTFPGVTAAGGTVASFACEFMFDPAEEA